MARGMITAYGMSEKLGRVRYQATSRKCSRHAVTRPKTSGGDAQIIDQEVRRLIEEARLMPSVS